MTHSDWPPFPIIHPYHYIVLVSYLLQNRIVKRKESTGEGHFKICSSSHTSLNSGLALRIWNIFDDPLRHHHHHWASIFSETTPLRWPIYTSSSGGGLWYGSHGVVRLQDLCPSFVVHCHRRLA